MPILESIRNDKPCTLRYIGNQYKKDRTISENEIKRIKDVLEAFENFEVQNSQKTNETISCLVSLVALLLDVPTGNGRARESTRATVTKLLMKIQLFDFQETVKTELLFLYIQPKHMFCLE